MLLGCIADDSTGASDLANTLAKGGMQTVQFIGIPGDDAVDCDAAVIALKTRSIPALEAVEQSLAALERLIALGCRQFIFKVCSTFDSTPEGNIGPVADALAERLVAGAVPVCPAFPDTGRTVYQGHLFVRGRLLSESGMENHPLNPMTDPDIRRWLARQSRNSVGHLPLPVVQNGAGAIQKHLGQAAADGFRLVICDAVRNADLMHLGEACADLPLLVGGSGIGLGLPANFAKAGLLQTAAPAFAGVDGPGCVLAGSCSSATLAQIAEYAKSHPSFCIEVGRALEDADLLDELVAFVHSRQDAEPLVYSSAEPETVRTSQRRFGADRVARTLERLFGAAAAALVRDGIRRLVVAGGETSGAVVSALRIRRLAIGPEIDPGVPALKVDGPPALALALKSGNFGGPDFFAKALASLGSRDVAG
ncbi:MAG: four-carbon acid sugar kinase family protein [Rhizobiales bacterium]|nr:four-carbon acid sugar kinase family protein [Hyphomicrobiales bacterium]